MKDNTLYIMPTTLADMKGESFLWTGHQGYTIFSILTRDRPAASLWKQIAIFRFFEALSLWKNKLKTLKIIIFDPFSNDEKITFVFMVNS